MVLTCGNVAWASISACSTSGNGTTINSFGSPTSDTNGCSQVDKTFANWVVGGSTTVSGAGNSVPGDTGLSILGLGTTAGATGASAIGIQITSTGAGNNDWSATTNSNTGGLAYTSTVTFSVTTSGPWAIDGATLHFNTLTIDKITGTIMEEICLGTSVFSSGCANKITLTSGGLTTSTTNFSTSASFGQFTTIAVRDTVFLDFGTINSTRGFTLDFLDNRFDQVQAVPEPTTFVLFGTALCALGLLSRRRRKQ